VTSLSTSDGARAIWPGVPDDLVGALHLFDHAGWRNDHTTDDLTQDLAPYRTPAGVVEVSTAAGVTFAVEPSTAEILDFERAEFPSWLQYYASTADDTLVGRGRDGAVVAAALLGGPGVASPFTPMLGGSAATIGCVGVAAALHGRGLGTALVARGSEILRDRGARVCHISWTTRTSFYEALGYVRWRSYRMYQRP
jgi:GNAT superfamily N-acetyltransferase